MATYLHGSQTIEKNAINLTIQDADISNVCIIGTKPTYLLEENNPIEKVVNFQETTKYIGNNIDGFTLPDAVETVLTESGGASIYTINIFDTEKHLAQKQGAIAFSNGKCVLNELGIQNLKLTKEDFELELNKDYSFENNIISILVGGVLENDSTGVNANYSYVDFTKITDSDVIGTTDENGKRSGIQKIYDIIATYGVIPGIIIAPGFTSKNVRTAIETIAEKLEAFAYFDCDKNTTIPMAEKARLKEVDGVDLTTTSQRSDLCVPWVNRYNSYQNTTTLKPLSPVVAGLRVKLDRERNVAKSIDNTASKTIKSTQFPISFMINDSTTDANRLNAQGILTVINHKGEYYIWGGRNASFPSETGLMTFESARRTRDFINKSIRDTSFVCIGDNITQGFIDDVLNAINSAFAKWSNPANKNQHIIYEGEAYWDESLNTAEDIANGKIRFPYKCCPLATAENIEFHDILDISLITKTLNS